MISIEDKRSENRNHNHTFSLTFFQMITLHASNESDQHRRLTSLISLSLSNPTTKIKVIREGKKREEKKKIIRPYEK